MKKLMFVAAVAAAMTGLADVEGQNIVGYQAAELQDDGMHPTVMQFKNLAHTDTKLSEFKPNELVTKELTKFNLLNPANGATLKFFGDDLGELYPEGLPEDGLYATFVYATEEMDYAPANGWYLFDEAKDYIYDHPMNEYTMPFGFGYLCECYDTGAALTESGEVTQGSDFEVPLSAGKQIVGNAAVVKKTLADFIPNEFVTKELTKLSLLNPANGATLKFFGDDLGDLYPEGIPDGGLYATFVFATEEMDYAPADGWYLFDEAKDYIYDHPMNAFEIEAGQGFECECYDDGATIEIPGSL